MSADVAPVAVFAYRRPDHLARTLASLAACPEAGDTDLIVFSDGPRGEADAEDVSAVRELASGIAGFRSVAVVEREGNRGLAANIIDGVTRVLAERERVIVLEDDMVVSRDFLTYMNQALDMYADEARVVSIHGYVYPTEDPLPDYFFLRGADCWGWGTWRRGWSVFDADGADLLRRIEEAGLEREFDLDGGSGYTQMLRDQVAGRIDSWAVRWYASAFLADLLTLYPGRSLVENIGLDGSGTHSRVDRQLVTPVHSMAPLTRQSIEESAPARSIISRTLRRNRSAFSRLRSWLTP